MTRLQINLNFLRVKSKKLTTGSSKTAASVDHKASHLVSIEISLDGKDMFYSEDDFGGRKGKKPRISDYLLDPEDITINAFIENVPYPHPSGPSIEQTTEGDHAVSTFVPKFPDCEDEEDCTSVIETTTTGSAICIGESQVTAALLVDGEMAATPSDADPESEEDCVVTEKCSFSVASLLKECRERIREDAEAQTPPEEMRECAVETIPIYLSRFGCSGMWSHGMPLAWPPTADYKCAITFVDIGRTYTGYVVLMDGKDNVGIAYEETLGGITKSTFDGYVIHHLKRVKDRLRHRPLIIVAEPFATLILTRKRTPSLEEFVDSELSAYDVSVVRGSNTVKMMKSLLFCGD